MCIGSQHPNSPYVEIGQIATAFYFSWFSVIVPVLGFIENTFYRSSNWNKIIIIKLPTTSIKTYIILYFYQYLNFKLLISNISIANYAISKKSL